MTLEDLGYQDWFRAGREEAGADEERLARIVAIDRGRCTIASPLGTVPAEVSGRLLYCAATPEDLPCVGDWVVVEHVDRNEHAVVHRVLPRKTVLRRRAAGGRTAYQAIAANIDVAYILQSCDVDYSLNRLDRYVVMAADGGITPRVLLTKSDLVSPSHVERLIAEVRAEHRIEAAAISSATGAGYERLAASLEAGRTYCLLGSSGVGKSTLLNALLETDRFSVGSVREKSGKGRHTTTRRELVPLDNGALFVDTPGMRELGMMAFESGLEEHYADVVAGAEECRYADCTHTVEDGCAVLAKVRSGELSARKYESYLKLRKESEHFGMSYQEQRKKDKAFGKMIKNYKKSQGKG